MRRLPLFLLLPVFLLVLAPALVHAEDEEASEAARLFREAWWLETGASALEKASESYRKAVTAEGSNAIRARSQYRLALVLERMGKTEDAMLALEKLAKDFPGQTELLEKALARMEEWAGQDLREYFSEWYLRYQYSPAFQSKIVDLVLQLGAPDDKVANAAKEELLTIGEPALPALKEHANSANSKLRRNVVTLLLQLKQLPTAEAFYQTNACERSNAFWAMLHKAETRERAAYRVAADGKPEDWRSAWLLAFLDGPRALVEALRKSPSSGSSPAWALLPTFMEMDPSPEALTTLREMPLDKEVNASLRSTVANFLSGRSDWREGGQDATGLTDRDVLAWAQSDATKVRQTAWNLMGASYLRDPDAWQVPARWLTKASLPNKEAANVTQALLGQLRRAQPGRNTNLAVEAMVKSLEKGQNSWNHLNALRENSSPGSTEVPRLVVARAIGKAKGNTVGQLPRYWWQSTQNDPSLIDTIVGWVKDAEDGAVRSQALSMAAYEMRSGIGQLLGALRDESRRVELRRTLFQSLQNNQGLEALDWDVETITQLVEIADSESKQRGGRKERTWSTNHAGVGMRMKTTFRSETSRTLFRLLQDRSLRRFFFEGAQQAPERFTRDVWLLLGEEWREAKENRALARGYLEKGWTTWSPERKQAGMRVFLSEQLVGRGDEELNDFLRRCLADPQLSPAGRSTAARGISDLALQDVLGAFDLSVPEQALLAVNFAMKLPNTPETYDAFKGLINEKTTSEIIVDRMAYAFRHGPEAVYADFVRRLFSVAPGTQAAREAAGILKRRNDAKDLPLWRIALSHPESQIRVVAAEQLGNLYDDDSVRALARLVDDPDPQVRDAALQSLERIETIEKQKDRWRKFADGIAPGPGKK